jgi:hypothetical protein
MRVPAFQNRGDMISIVSCCVVLHTPSHGEAQLSVKRSMYQCTPSRLRRPHMHPSLDSIASNVCSSPAGKRPLPISLAQRHMPGVPQQIFSLLLRCSCVLPCEEAPQAPMGVFVFIVHSRGRLNAYKASLIYFFGECRGIKHQIVMPSNVLKSEDDHPTHSIFTSSCRLSSPPSTMKHGTPSRHDPGEYAKNSSAT